MPDPKPLVSSLLTTVTKHAESCLEEEAEDSAVAAVEESSAGER